MFIVLKSCLGDFVFSPEEKEIFETKEDVIYGCKDLQEAVDFAKKEFKQGMAILKSNHPGINEKELVKPITECMLNDHINRLIIQIRSVKKEEINNVLTIEGRVNWSITDKTAYIEIERTIKYPECKNIDLI